MLVLSRVKDESIVISFGDVRAEVLIVDVRGSKVRLGIEAPEHVTINRKEVQMMIDKESGYGDLSHNTGSTP